MMRATLFLAAALLCATSASATCANDCNGHGTCNIYSSCDCYRNWMGADCSQRVCYFGIAFVDTPQGDLNTDGYVSDNQYDTRFTNEQTWEVYPWYAGYGGLNFDYESSSATEGVDWEVTGDMKGEGHFYKECSSKGICDRDSGVCECFPGFDGEGCARTACPNDCSGHGLCRRIGDIEAQYAGWDAASTQSCVCDSGYMGADCSLRACPAGDDAVTKYKGYTRISFVEAATGVDYYDTQMCPIATDNTASDSYPDFGPSKNRLWDFKIDSENPYANGWQWNPWFSSSTYSTNVYILTTDATIVWPKYTVIKKGTTDAYVVLGGVTNNGAGTTPPVLTDEATEFVVAAYTVITDADGLWTADACGSPVGSIPDNFPETWPATAANSDCATAEITRQESVHVELCGSDTAASNQLCTDAVVTPYSRSPIATYSGMKVTGNASQATGYATAGCEAAGDCDFWSLYLERTEGTFQYGDVIEVSASAGANAYTPAFDFSLCNYIASIDMYYAATPTTVQQNEVQMLSLYMQPAAITDKFQVRSIYPWLEGETLLASKSYTATWQQLTGGAATACSTFPAATFDTDADGAPIKSTIIFSEFGECADIETEGFEVALFDGTNTITVEARAAGSVAHLQALGLIDDSQGDITGDFQGYFALEFTDETGDTWMTESIAVSSAAVAHDPADLNLVAADTDVGMKDISSDQTLMQAAGIPATAVAAVELDPAVATVDFVATQKMTSDSQFVSDLRSGQAVADRIEAALEALPNGVLSDVEVYYQHTMPDLDGATLADLQSGFTKNFRISFVSNSGDVPALRVAYSFVDSDGDPGLTGKSGSRQTYANGNCGGLTGASVDETGNDGCATNAFGEASLIEPRGVMTGNAWPIYRPGAEITTIMEGTTENAECSNRGLCDYTTGECKCFSGFTDMDCSTQNALSMG